ncbi:polysaccharide biosynthesis/export family protein [Planktotalea sp.]|uniref:polysaccharide biosynthesis/export family protein n=1 Tax=Planktotalea sp. TaxID=2029877 RepID=UPI0032969EEA
MRRLILGLCAITSLAACDLVPRGAGLQSEVLAAEKDENGNEITQFAVEPVTRANLATFVNWRPADSSHYHWINRVDQPNNRIIRPGDSVSITVWTTDVDGGLLTSPGQRSVPLADNRVSPNGTIFLPYLGDFKISGNSPERARERIEEKYSETMPSAQIQLKLTEGVEQSVSLISGVAAPGTYPLASNDYTILQIIAEGGGMATFTNPQVRLHRSGKIYGVSANRLLNEPRLNTTLRGGDRIYVEEDERTFLSLGAAGTEAVHAFTSDNVSALEALSIIGGVSDTRADAKGILILRRYPLKNVTADRSGPDHPRTIFTLDLTSADGLFSADQFEIESGDLIYVSESPLTAVQSVFSIFTSVIGLNNAIN